MVLAVSVVEKLAELTSEDNSAFTGNRKVLYLGLILGDEDIV